MVYLGFRKEQPLCAVLCIFRPLSFKSFLKSFKNKVADSGNHIENKCIKLSPQ